MRLKNRVSKLEGRAAGADDITLVFLDMPGGGPDRAVTAGGEERLVPDGLAALAAQPPGGRGALILSGADLDACLGRTPPAGERPKED